MSRRTRLLLTFLPGLLALPFLAAHGPIPQDLHYHEFADQRTVWGIPHFGDVITNLPFLAVGVAGLLARPRCEFAVFFAGVALTGLGSGYYHLDPTNETLVWDRLPMTVAFMGIGAALFAERVDAAIARRALSPLVALGAASVLYWAVADDLRPYAFVQFYPMLVMVGLLLLFPGRSGHCYWLALASYVAAKLAELFDHEVFALNGFVTGHNTKHLLAALGAYWIVRRVAKDAAAGCVR